MVSRRHLRVFIIQCEYVFIIIYVEPIWSNITKLNYIFQDVGIHRYLGLERSAVLWRRLVLRGFITFCGLYCCFTLTFMLAFIIQRDTYSLIYTLNLFEAKLQDKIIFSRRWYPQVLKSWEVGTVASFGAQRLYNLLRSLMLFYPNIYISVHHPTWSLIYTLNLFEAILQDKIIFSRRWYPQVL